MLLCSPAKINLFFRVLGKRSDGYHEIASLFQAIDLCDTIHFIKSESDRFSCSDSRLFFDSSNLVIKALRLFRSHYPFSFGVSIHLHKQIPLQAGLGGGSSNAATTLWALNELTDRPASLSALMKMGEQIGSDVPFFFSTGTAYCTGRGELVEPFQLPQPMTGWLIKPSFGLSTPLVYQETRVQELPLRNPRLSLAEYPLFYNDLEPAAFRLKPRLQQLCNQLKRAGFNGVTMTGSGTSFFSVGNGGNCKTLKAIPFSSLQRDGDLWYPIPPV